MIIMAIDLGRARTGLAVCDKEEILASPLCTITEKNLETLAEKIKEKIIETKSQLLVIGLPLNMDGTYGESAKNAIKFKEMLALKVTTPIKLWDERKTTFTAHEYLNTLNVRGIKRKNIIDALSASIILENYLNYRKRNSQIIL